MEVKLISRINLVVIISTLHFLDFTLFDQEMHILSRKYMLYIFYLKCAVVGQIMCKPSSFWHDAVTVAGRGLRLA
jgi:hypothetical protein